MRAPSPPDWLPYREALRPLAEGDVARVRLVLADGRKLFAEFPVRRAAP